MSVVLTRIQHGKLKGISVDDALIEITSSFDKQIRKIEDDMCDFILLNGEMPKDVYTLSTEEYLELDNKL